MVAIFADTDKMKNRFFLPLLVFAFAFSLETASALEYIRFIRDGKERNEEGRIILEARTGIAFEARDGRLYDIMPENIITRSRDDTPFVPYTKAEMIERLKEEFPPDEGYFFLDNGPFIVVYTTSRSFATWYGRLLERLHSQYVQHWRRRGVELIAPEFPLVAIVLSNEERFRQHARQTGATLFPEQRAYYHKLSNRIVLYDMSGLQAFREGDQRRIATDIQRFLSHPSAYHNVMTVVHEGVHQVGFNTGMHPRYAPSPRWLLEGLALFHEVPDTNNRTIGWTLGPRVNSPRLEHLRRYLNRPHHESPIKKMLQEDDLFRRSETALDYYALAWGLIYYLERQKPKALAAYLKILQAKTPRSNDNAEIRIRDFESAFGSDWNTFERDFVNYLRRL